MVSGVELIMMVQLIMILELSVDSLDTTHIVRHIWQLATHWEHPLSEGWKCQWC